ncbi:unnamed protein product [Peniophora sp. CBMAI 1063]|nr:unnamed protein product [Peniophora sp. CBMAI 1063]
MPHALEETTMSTSSSDGSMLRRSWHAMAERFSPFSPAAMAKLPKPNRPVRYTRADDIPDAEPDEEGNLPAVRDYHAINSVPTNIRVPKKVATPVRVEGKVWFANERTWIAYMNMAILIATFAVALFNASADDVSRYFAYFYALVSVGVLVYGYVLYQHRITMIRRRDPGHFDAIAGPVVISAFLFFGVLVNFIIRFREVQRKGAIPSGTQVLSYFTL